MAADHSPPYPLLTPLFVREPNWGLTNVFFFNYTIYINMIKLVGNGPAGGHRTVSKTGLFSVFASSLWLFWTTSCTNLENPIRAGRGSPVGSPVLSHDLAIGGVMHASGFCQPIDNCSACHGANLQGGSQGQPSCTKCHSDRWNRNDCGRTSHTINLKGINHAANYCQPLQNCTACHGLTLQGGTSGEPSCFKCHQDRWNRASCGKSVHTVSLRGVLHGEDYCRPNQNCAECHGTDLKGGQNGEPSCFKCHGERWTLAGCGTNIHTVSLKGINHAPEYCTPFQSCVTCHGPSLQGGSTGEPSCYQCHGEWWKRSGCGNSIHTVSLGGVSHAPNYCLPYQNCTECHGQDLRGGPYGEPSCLKCHTQKKWQNCGSIQHNRREDGVYHAADYCKPLQYCAQCHGSNLRGGPNNEPSCYKCHGEKWNSSDCGR